MSHIFFHCPWALCCAKPHMAGQSNTETTSNLCLRVQWIYQSRVWSCSTCFLVMSMTDFSTKKRNSIHSFFFLSLLYVHRPPPTSHKRQWEMSTSEQRSGLSVGTCYVFTLWVVFLFSEGCSPAVPALCWLLFSVPAVLFTSNSMAYSIWQAPGWQPDRGWFFLFCISFSFASPCIWRAPPQGAAQHLLSPHPPEHHACLLFVLLSPVVQHCPQRYVWILQHIFTGWLESRLIYWLQFDFWQSQFKEYLHSQCCKVGFEVGLVASMQNCCHEWDLPFMWQKCAHNLQRTDPP